MSKHAPTPWHVSMIPFGNLRLVMARGPLGEQIVAYNMTAADAELIVTAVNAHDDLLAALEAIDAFARSGWRKEGGQFYCLVCDESLCLTPGATKGKRAESFEEITHDPECPVPDVIATIRKAKGERA